MTTSKSRNLIEYYMLERSQSNVVSEDERFKKGDRIVYFGNSGTPRRGVIHASGKNKGRGRITAILDDPKRKSGRMVYGDSGQFTLEREYNKYAR